MQDLYHQPYFEAGGFRVPRAGVSGFRALQVVLGFGGLGFGLGILFKAFCCGKRSLWMQQSCAAPQMDMQTA